MLSPLDGIAREIIEDGKEGFVMEDPDDSEAVSETLRGLLDDSQRRKQMGELGRRTAVERFSVRAKAQAMSSLYREVAGRRDRKGAARA